MKCTFSSIFVSFQSDQNWVRYHCLKFGHHFLGPKNAFFQLWRNPTNWFLYNRLMPPPRCYFTLSHNEFQGKWVEFNYKLRKLWYVLWTGQICPFWNFFFFFVKKRCMHILTCNFINTYFLGIIFKDVILETITYLTKKITLIGLLVAEICMFLCDTSDFLCGKNLIGCVQGPIVKNLGNNRPTVVISQGKHTSEE